MKKIVLNNQPYLGTIKESAKGVVTLENALRYSGTLNQPMVNLYFKAQNSGSLETAKVTGQNTISVSDLTEDEELMVAIADMQMNRAKVIAVPNLVNDAFDNITGK